MTQQSDVVERLARDCYEAGFAAGIEEREFGSCKRQESAWERFEKYQADLLTLIESLQAEYKDACHHINLQVARAEKLEKENALLREGLERVAKVRPNQLAALVIKKMRTIATRTLEEK